MLPLWSRGLGERRVGGRIGGTLWGDASVLNSVEIIERYRLFSSV